jgi:hypothetical protein
LRAERNPGCPERLIMWRMSSVSVVPWKNRSFLKELFFEGLGVGDIAVVGQGNLSFVGEDVDRLDVQRGVSPAGGVASVSNPNVGGVLLVGDSGQRTPPTRPRSL